MYYSRASMFLLPTNWTRLASAGGEKSLPFIDGSGSTSISSGSTSISNPSFLLTDLPPVSGDHYCIIAIVQTTAHPVTIHDKFPTNGSFCQWTQQNPAVCFRNISYSPNTLTQLNRVFSFGNVNQKDAYFTIVITGRGFVTGTMIKVQCTDKNCPIEQNLSLPKADSQGNQIVSFVTEVPAGFWGDLVVTATSPAGEFPAGASLTSSYFQIPDKTDALDVKVARRFLTSSGIGEDSEFTTAMLIKLGECAIDVTDNPQKIK
ncbi:hypothetical protein [Methanolacinia petrolearia]|uniref:hypothetical protein n=1 Tax=Methanolacinia petrolearia TaxID=54120 RepID=UPI003BA9094F